MSDSTETAGPLEWRQRYADDIETIQTHLDGRQAQIHTAMPGSIVSYDPTKMTATVQLSMQAVHEKLDGTTEAITIHPVADVPVHFPSGGGHTLTFPIKAGDECLVIFSERNIDAWHQHGGTQQPTDYRMHDINDCFVQVGLRSQPNLLSNVSPTTVQLRSDDGTCFIEVDGMGGKMTLKCPQEITLDTPRVTLTGVIAVKGAGGGEVGTFAGSIAATGEVTAKDGPGHVNLSTHHHPAVNAPPTPGT
jgi:hypothetical protein